jgi:hypothetical protein
MVRERKFNLEKKKREGIMDLSQKTVQPHISHVKHFVSVSGPITRCPINLEHIHRTDANTNGHDPSITYKQFEH